MQEEGRMGLSTHVLEKKNTTGLFILKWISFSIMLDCANQEQEFMVTFSYIHHVQQNYKAFFHKWQLVNV